MQRCLSLDQNSSPNRSCCLLRQPLAHIACHIPQLLRFEHVGKRRHRVAAIGDGLGHLRHSEFAHGQIGAWLSPAGENAVEFWPTASEQLASKTRDVNKRQTVGKEFFKIEASRVIFLFFFGRQPVVRYCINP